ncbi:MAG: RNA polymerase sigma factor [Pseudomonadota bacterium]
MHSLCAANEDMGSSEAAPTTLDGFLASVERQAFVIARRATGDSDVALDLVQESMYRLVDQYSSREPHEWRPLFFTILQRQITDHHRPRGVVGRLRRWFGEPDNSHEATDQLPASEPEPSDASDAQETTAAVRDALSRLPPRQQQVFMLRQWQGLSVEETARAMGVSSGSVKTHLSRALSNLREQLEEHRP